MPRLTEHDSQRISSIVTCPNNRSKFNVALGIEAQGFCLIK
jgi:hypothetical protein